MKDNTVNIKGLSTEQDSFYRHIEKMSVTEITSYINAEDHKVAKAVKNSLSAINALVEYTVTVIKNGGRIFYIGAGTSGRLGVVDASECPPTFGTDFGTVIGIIAGGDGAIRKAVEDAEDSTTQGFLDLQLHHVSIDDIVIGIAASGRTPYVVHALAECRKRGIKTGCIVCNTNSELAQQSDYPVEIAGLGPEFITGSTRMKSGTAQKMVLNIITTTTFALNGGVIDNKMSRMMPTNAKLRERQIGWIMDGLNISREEVVERLKTSTYEKIIKNK